MAWRCERAPLWKIFKYGQKMKILAHCAYRGLSANFMLFCFVNIMRAQTHFELLNVLGTWEFRSSTLLKIWPGFHLLAQQLYCWSYLLRNLDLVFVPRDQRSVHLSILYWNSISIRLILATLMIRFRSFSDNIDVIRFFKKIILFINHIKINCYIVKKKIMSCVL